MTTKYRQGSTFIHYIFTPKYRLALLEDTERSVRLRGLLVGIAKNMGADVKAIAVMPDHVHMMLYLPRTETIANLARQLKRQTSFSMRRIYPDLKQHRAFWGEHYWHRSIGGDAGIVQKYIDKQFSELGLEKEQQ